MIRKQDILKMVKNVYRHSRGLPSRRLIHPAREWGIGVIIAVLLIIGGAISSGYIYTQLNSLDETIEPAAVDTVRYQESTVERALELYAERDRRFNASIEAAVPVDVPAPQATNTATTSVREIQPDETDIPPENQDDDTVPLTAS